MVDLILKVVESSQGWCCDADVRVSKGKEVQP
jgi:hypothetical protein